MELRHLRYFVALAEELNFSRAAEKLMISQPPLSLQIRQLEEEMDVRLFRRTKRSVQLTEAGSCYYSKVKPLLADLERAVESARRTQSGELGQILLGFAGIAFSLMPQLVKKFREEHPCVGLDIRQMSSADQLSALQKEAIHVGIVCATVQSVHVSSHVIQKQKLVVALPETHSLAISGKPVMPCALSGESFITTPRSAGESYYDCIINICRSGGFTPDVVQEAGEIHTILSLVSAGIGVALVPESAKKISIGGVCLRDIGSALENMLETALIWRSGETSPAAHLFIALALEQCAIYNA